MSVDAAFFASARSRATGLTAVRASGSVRACVGTAIEATGLRPSVGARCAIAIDGAALLDAEVIGFREDAFVLMPLARHEGIRPGARVWARPDQDGLPVASRCFGRVLDGRGLPLDGKQAPPFTTATPLHRAVLPPLDRARICEPLDVGVRAINGLLTVGRGARLGLFAGSGVGKSTLLGQVARNTDADANVIALVGERGREVREFLERDLGPEGLARSIVVVATGDETPLLRVRAAHLATALAEQLRDDGRHVLMVMDSLTRFSLAVREIGLAAGEPPTTRGYTPSVFSSLPRLVERAGSIEGGGSITGIYGVLVEGDDLEEPVADAARSVLDGHIVLARELAERGHFPPIDIGSSVSRVMSDVVSSEHRALAMRARSLLAAYRGAEDLISIGAYVKGTDAEVDEARRLKPSLDAYLRQSGEECDDMVTSVERLRDALRGEAA